MTFLSTIDIICIGGDKQLNTVNERIKYIRKNILKISQQELARKIGVSQNAISWSEKPNNNVSDSNIKSICNFFNINENWLRNGIEPIFIAKEEEFNLDAFAKERGASEFDLKILKAYLGLDKEVRNAIMEQFKKEFGNQEGIFKPISVEEIQESYAAVPEEPMELEKLAASAKDKKDVV